jgi:putative hemolysin
VTAAREANVPNPFRVPSLPFARLPQRLAVTLARPLLDWALGLPRFRELYREAQHAPDEAFTARALRALGIDVAVASGSVRDLPPTGPLLVVANHPHGILDGLALAHLAHERRADVRVLTSHLLASIPELADLCLFVDPFGGGSAAARSRAGLRAAKRWLDDGHALVVFPAGSVAHERRATGGAPIDSGWHTTAARLAAGSHAVVVPAFIGGANSEWFYRAGQIHERLRTLLLGRELLRHRGRSVAVHLGEPVASTAAAPHDSAAMTAIFRRAVEHLGARAAIDRSPRLETVAPGPPAAALAHEVNGLPGEALLIRSGSFDVFCAEASAIPTVLRELGRLREISFRTVGEGTGKALDLDRFDDHYRHLFVWNRDACEIAGAYRLGLTDDIVRVHGIDGLYTSTLFRYDARLLAQLGPAIELGRSFVRAEYQRSSSALLLLWKGIARVVAKSGKYRVLFGPVSVSSRYVDMSHQLLKAFLTQNHYRRDLAELVEALTPAAPMPATRDVEGRTFSSLADLDRAIAAIESDGKGVPVLLRQYLKLNAKLLGFNVDPDFGDALDALMMVDLADVEPAVLRRYFGNDARHFAPPSRGAAA